MFVMFSCELVEVSASGGFDFNQTQPGPQGDFLVEFLSNMISWYLWLWPGEQIWLTLFEYVSSMVQVVALLIKLVVQGLLRVA